MFLVPNGLKELSEMRFEYLSNLIGKSIVAFLTGSLLRVLKSWYTGGAQNKDFSAVSRTDLIRRLLPSVVQIPIHRLVNLQYGFKSRSLII